MRKLLVAVAVLVVLLVVAVVAVPFLVPKEAVVARLEKEVEARTGRAFDIGGPVDFSFYPNLAVTARDVRFAGFEGGQDLMRLGRLDLRLKLMPLFSGQVLVDRFVLVEPQLALEVDKQGRANWDVPFGTPTPQPAEGGPAVPVEEVNLGDLEIVDGSIAYVDHRTGVARAVENLDATVTSEGLDDPLTVDATLTLDGRPVGLDVTAGAARALVEGGETDLDLSLEAPGVTAALDGRLSKPLDRPPSVTGDLKADVGSVAGLMEWLTKAKPEAAPVETVKLAGRLSASAERISVANLNLNADELAAAGELAVALGGRRPALKGALQVSRLDLDRFLPAGGDTAPAATAAAPAPVPAGGGVAPAAGAPAAGQEWSREPIDLAALSLVDADLDLKLAGIAAKGVEVGATTLGIDLKDGRLAARLAPTAIFGGTIGGDLVLASGKANALELRAAADGVQAEPLLTRFADFRRLSGTMQAKLDLRAAGASQYDLVRTLDGTADLVFRDGAVKGINVASLVRSVTGGASDGPQQTDFAELGGSFRIDDGLARNEDFRLLAPLLRVTGGGQVMLPERRVDYRIVPRVVATIEGQGAQSADQKGLSVPVLVRGTFADLKFTPDLSGVAEQALRDPAAIKEQVKGLRDTVKGATQGANPAEAVKGLMEGLLGGKAPAPAAPPPGGQ
ncbi:MAG TPA: AsmA family protein [Azospirillaceae bacterium]|nr:AsmA family protein [Azospirillaceae bacterium]